MNTPLVSVVIPTYNREKKIKTAIDSVLNQTYHNWELIVVDDYSNDNTKKLISTYFQKDKRIQYCKNCHKKGPAGARNTGIELAKGDYITLLDSDDEFIKHHMSVNVKNMEKENLIFLSTLVYKRRDGLVKPLRGIDKCIQTLNPVNNGSLYYFDKRLFEYVLLNPLQIYSMDGTFFKRELIQKVGLFNENLFPNGEDHDFIYRVILNNYFVLLNEYTAIWNEGDDNLTARAKNAKIDYTLIHLHKRCRLFFYKLVKTKILKN